MAKKKAPLDAAIATAPTSHPNATTPVENTVLNAVATTFKLDRASLTRSTVLPTGDGMKVWDLMTALETQLSLQGKLTGLMNIFPLSIEAIIGVVSAAQAS